MLAVELKSPEPKTKRLPPVAFAIVPDKVLTVVFLSVVNGSSMSMTDTPNELAVELADAVTPLIMLVVETPE
jgi:hypothetical protein